MRKLISLRLVLLALVSAGAVLLSPQDLSAADVKPRDGLNATLWKQNSVEYRANALALFQLAKIRLDEALADTSASALDQTNASDQPPAIIMDVDDTLLDSGPYQSWVVKAGTEFTAETWAEWKKTFPAKPIPGSLKFAQYAASKDVAVFYVTNRSFDEKDLTAANLRRLGYPMSETEDRLFMLKQEPDWTRDKTVRRRHVAKTHRVLLLIGDHWGDVSDVSEGTEADRHRALEQNLSHIGKDWLILANPAYGLFLSAPFDDDFSLSRDQQRQKKLDALNAWSGPTSSP